MNEYSKARRDVVDTALEGVRQRAGIHYTQAAARWDGIDRHLLGTSGQPHYADCSSYTTWLFWQARTRIRGNAGVDVINGYAWKAGNTTTQLLHGQRHSPKTRKFWRAGGTLVFYGRPYVTHVAIYVGRKNGVEMVVSHGQEAGPLLLPWNYRGDFNQARAYPM